MLLVSPDQRQAVLSFTGSTGSCCVKGAMAYHAELFIRCKLCEKVDVCDLSAVVHHIPPHGCRHTHHLRHCKPMGYICLLTLALMPPVSVCTGKPIWMHHGRKVYAVRRFVHPMAWLSWKALDLGQRRSIPLKRSSAV